MQDIGISALNRGTQLLITYFIPAIIQVVLSCLLLGIKLNVTVMLIILLYGVFFISVAYYANKNINKYLDVAIDIFHKSKNDLSFADYLYRRILNIHA